MERDNKTVSRNFLERADSAFRIIKRLIAGHRASRSLLAAAWEISHAANRQYVSHAELKQIADRVYRRHGILTASIEESPSAASAGEGLGSEPKGANLSGPLPRSPRAA